MQPGGQDMSDEKLKIAIEKKKLKALMKQHNIETDFQLLEKIGVELNKKDTYKFACNERPNFSKMINGTRPLKVEFIIPLENIFKLPISRLTQGGNGYAKFEEKDLSLIKGIRYFAYMDDMKLYENEFKKMMFLEDDHTILINTDEFNKSFLDYVVEFRSINAIRFLVKEYKFAATTFDHKLFTIKYGELSENLYFRDNEEIALLIMESEDVDLLYKVFPMDHEIYLYHPDLPDRYFFNEKGIIQMFLNNQTLFGSLFRNVEFNFSEVNRSVSVFNKKPVDKNRIINYISPIVNICLNYALDNIDQYKEQAKKILQYGQQYNVSVINSIVEEDIPKSALYINSFGNLYCDYQILVGNLIFTNKVVEDNEIQSLIESLPLVRIVK